MAKKTLTPEEELVAIRKKLGYYTAEQVTKDWLNTGSRHLNSVLGSIEKGIPYGKMIEFHGMESNGKTLLLLLLASLAQRDDAKVGWMDLENSFDNDWATVQGLNYRSVAMFQPKLMYELERKGKRSKEPVLQSAQDLCQEAEMWMKKKHLENPKGKIFLGIDSVTAFMTDEEQEAGLLNQNMRTNVSLASYLSKLCRRWVSLAYNYNAMIVFVDQLRLTPGKVYGNPEYTPGGKALAFYCSIRAKIRRVKGGRILQKGRMVGLKGIIANKKNKSGEGCQEGYECGFKAYFHKHSWRFVAPEKIKREE